MSTDGTTLTVSFNNGSKPAGAQFSVSASGGTWSGEVDLVITYGARVGRRCEGIRHCHGRGRSRAVPVGGALRRRLPARHRFYGGRDLLPLRSARILAVPISGLRSD